jgi:phosphate:Na+ symporter
MFTTISTLIGGIGLFLLGMILMTDGLKALAGDALRHWLARFTGTSAKAVGTGIVLTSLVQSSSVTTMATIGFVSAGLLTFSNAIGVIIGANIGTTSTGWIVSLLGLKLSVGTLLLPLIGIGALLRLLNSGRWSHAGLAMAGFSVIFVGIDTMQTGMAGLADQIDLSHYSSSGITARFALVLIGLLMTVVMQSSSAAVATTLAALAAGTLSLEQAAALVIGQNVGTTINAVMAAIGASIAAKRTALIHVLFNLVTGMVAFALLPYFIAFIDQFTANWIGHDHALTIAAFHTAFNLLGAALFLPLTGQLVSLAEILIPEHRPALTRHLDTTMRKVPSLAVDAAGQALRECAWTTLQSTASRLRGEDSSLPLKTLIEVQEATAQITHFLAGLPEAPGPVLGRLNAVMHALDHVSQCAIEGSARELISAADRVPVLQPLIEQIAGTFLLGAQSLTDPEPPHPLEVIQHLEDCAIAAVNIRPTLLRESMVRHLRLEDALEGLNTLRHCERLIHSVNRALFYLNQLDELSRPEQVD